MYMYSTTYTRTLLGAGSGWGGGHGVGGGGGLGGRLFEIIYVPHNDSVLVLLAMYVFCIEFPPISNHKKT